MRKVKNRYFILFIASMVNFVHGNPYIWTVFQPYVKAEYDLSVAASSQPFTIIIGIFAIGNIIGGYLQHKIGAKWTILWGSFVMCIGFFLSAIAPHNMPCLVSAGYGALGGLGSGCAFSMLVAVPQAWFPDKRGLVTGITIGVVGISGIIMNPLCDFVLSMHGYRYAMIMITVIYAVLSLGAFLIEEAPDVKVCEEQEGNHGEQYTTKEMIKTKTFYMISLVMALVVPAYVFVNPLMKSLGMERGLTSSQALLGVMIASFTNIIGRFVAPWISDKIGCRKIMQIMYILAAVSVFGLISARGVLFVAFISLVCMVYGGMVSVSPVWVAQNFGMKYQGMNYGVALMGYGIVSILCPYLLEITGQTTSFIIAGICSLVGVIIMRKI